MVAVSDETFGIGELSRRTGVPAPTIRTWQARGLHLGRRTLGGHRRFTAEDVDRVTRFVVLMRDADHTIAGAIAKLASTQRIGGRSGVQGPTMIVPKSPIMPSPSPRMR